MINFILNELYKVFHKRSTIIYFIVVILFFALIGYLEKSVVLNDYTSNLDILIQNQSDVIDSFKDNKNLNDDEKADYIMALSYYDIYSLIKEKGYSVDSPERKYVESNFYDLYSKKYTYKIYGSDIDGYTLDEINKMIDEAVKKLDSFDAYANIKLELNNLNKDELCLNVRKEFCDKYFESYKKVLNYRIDMKIPYADTTGSRYLDNYIETLPSYLQHEKNKDILNEEEESIFRDETEIVKLAEYKIDNKVLTVDSEQKINMVEWFSAGITEFSIFIVVGLVMVAAGILSEEFEKGTIKQLLVKPFNRNKILISKIVATIIMIMVFMILTTVLNTVLGLIVFDDLSFKDVMYVYDFNVAKVVKVGIFEYYGLNFLIAIVKFIIIDLMVILISTISTSTALSCAFGFAILLSGEILTLFIDKYKWIAFLPMFTSDLSDYLFGGKSMYKMLTFTNQTLFNIAYVILFVDLALIIFKKKDIKNQ